MIHLETSVLLARLFARGRAPPPAFWSQTFVASRMLEFEDFNRVHARGAGAPHRADMRQFVDRVNLVELSGAVLVCALQPFAHPVRTLDALHLARLDFLGVQGPAVTLATCDQRLEAAALAMGLALADCQAPGHAWPPCTDGSHGLGGCRQGTANLAVVAKEAPH